MKLTEKQAFKILNKIIDWYDKQEILTENDKADFVMLNLINLELEK